MASKVPGFVYVLHFSLPVGNPNGHQARHYVGWAKDVDRRMGDHAMGNGAKITAAAVEAGAVLHVVHTRPGTRDDERILHNQGHLARLCPLCRSAELARHAERARSYRARDKERAA